MCSARALARRGRRPLQQARQRDGEVAAARTLLGSAGRVARLGGSNARQQAGEEEQRDAWAPARSKGAAGKALHGAGVGALHGGGEKQSRELGKRDKGRFEISKTSRDHSVNKQ